MVHIMGYIVTSVSTRHKWSILWDNHLDTFKRLKSICYYYIMSNPKAALPVLAPTHAGNKTTKPVPVVKSTLMDWFMFIINILFTCLAVYLNWNCNINEQMMMRGLYLLIAFIFPYYYAGYYGIYHLLMKNPC